MEDSLGPINPYRPSNVLDGKLLIAHLGVAGLSPVTNPW